MQILNATGAEQAEGLPQLAHDAADRWDAQTGGDPLSRLFYIFLATLSCRALPLVSSVLPFSPWFNHNNRPNCAALRGMPYRTTRGMPCTRVALPYMPVFDTHRKW